MFKILQDSITVNGTISQAPMYYLDASSSSVVKCAILTSNTPGGQGVQIQTSDDKLAPNDKWISVTPAATALGQTIVVLSKDIPPSINGYLHRYVRWFAQTANATTFQIFLDVI